MAWSSALILPMEANSTLAHASALPPRSGRPTELMNTMSPEMRNRSSMMYEVEPGVWPGVNSTRTLGPPWLKLRVSPSLSGV